ncbi:PID-CTERM protein-sorting domain-containing protein [Marinoscillum furvescens]|nr:hypothetical protein [Marinoscillum furvescens]
MNASKKHIFRILCCVAITPVFAQGPPPATPIDGGISVLLAAAGVYVLRMLCKNEKPR